MKGGVVMKNSILIFALLLPAFSFGGLARVKTFTDGTNTVYKTINFSYVDDLYSIYFNTPFGLMTSRNLGAVISPVPSSDTSVWAKVLNNQISLVTNNPTNSPADFASVNKIFATASSLLNSGYSGPGVLYHEVFGFRHCFNIDFSLMVQDVLSSTNTVFRQILLSHLSSISSHVSSIDSSVASISNLVYSISSSVQSDPFQVDFVSAVRTLQSTSSLGSIDYDGIIQEYNDLPSSESRSLYARGFSRLFDSQKGAQGLLNGFGNSDSLPSVGRKFNSSINDALTGSASGHGSGGIAGDIKRLTTNDWASVVTNQLAQNTRDTKKQLKDNHDSITNQLAHMFDDNPNSVGRAIRSTAANTATAAQGVSAISSKLDSLHVQIDNPNSIGVILDGPVTIDTTQFNGVSVPLSGLKDKIDTWYNDWYSFWDVSTPAYSWSSFYNQVRDFKDQNHSDLSAITNSLRGVFSVTGDVSRIYDYLSGSQSNLLEVIANSITNNWDDYYFKRFRRANEFSDEDDQAFTLEGASETIFGRGFDEGEYSRLNWFSRVELLLFQLSAVSSGTNALESVDIEDDLNNTVDSFNQHGQDFVNASRRVVGVFRLIDGFAASMRSAFGGYSNPVTSGIVLLPAGSWIFDNALVLEVPVTIQNALRLVFQCIWYLSAFVVAWRVVVATWSRVVSFVRWLWSVFDI